MPTYAIAPLISPQYVGSVNAALTFRVSGTPTTVPANTNFLIQTCRVTNISAAPVTLTLYRVPQGATPLPTNLLVPNTVIIPVATQTFPQFDVTALWGAVLLTGDSIWATAGAASALVIEADGAIITP